MSEAKQIQPITEEALERHSDLKIGEAQAIVRALAAGCDCATQTVAEASRKTLDFFSQELCKEDAKKILVPKNDAKAAPEAKEEGEDSDQDSDSDDDKEEDKSEKVEKPAEEKKQERSKSRGRSRSKSRGRSPAKSPRRSRSRSPRSNVRPRPRSRSPAKRKPSRSRSPRRFTAFYACKICRRGFTTARPESMCSHCKLEPLFYKWHQAERSSDGDRIQQELVDDYNRKFNASRAKPRTPAEKRNRIEEYLRYIKNGGEVERTRAFVRDSEISQELRRIDREFDRR